MLRKSLTCAAAVAASLAAPAFALDGTAVNPNPSASNPAARAASRAVEHRNPLPAPDDSLIELDQAPTPHAARVLTQDGMSTRAFGSFGIPYTATRVQLGAQSAAGASFASYLSTTWPYRAIGKLTFIANGRQSWCTATLIRRSVVVTAAHCIQSFGSGNAIFSNFQFRPGHYGAAGATAAQIAPHGTWNWHALVRPVKWMNGTDTGAGSARENDLAMIVLERGAGGQFVGDATGWIPAGLNNYSFVSSANTGNLNVAAVTTLGYPGLLDGGDIMQRTDGPAYTATVSGARQIRQGSNLTGGSSGGPWIVNFKSQAPALSGGAAPGTADLIAIVGVTSWGSANPNAPKDNYSSQFSQNATYPNAAYGIYGGGNIGSLLNTVCSLGAPGGGTFASNGYCN